MAQLTTYVTLLVLAASSALAATTAPTTPAPGAALMVNEMTVIITNSSHSPERQNNDLAHEIARIVPKHQPTQAFFTHDGMLMMKHYDQTLESEADCLAITLLVPRQALMDLMARGYDDRRRAAHFKVSGELLKMRQNLTGVGRRLSRRAARAI